jgi:hypothetical protein
MGARDRRVVVEDRYVRRDVRDEPLSRAAMPAAAQLDTYEKLGDGNRGDGNVVVIVDEVIEGRPGPVGIDQERRVEQEPGQERSSTSSSCRSDARSPAKAGSAGCRPSKALTSLPFPVLTGSSWATTLPRRTIVNRSP